MEIRIPPDKYNDLNNDLARQYKTSRDYIEKQKLIKHLYDIDYPLFKEWNLFDKGALDDFKQEAFLLIERALSTFDPGKGAFITWLKRFYIPRAWKEVTKEHDRRKSEWVMVEGDDRDQFLLDNDYPDYLYWRKLRGELTEMQWICIYETIFNGYSLQALSKKIGVKACELGKAKQQALHKIKVLQFQSLQTDNTKTDYYQEKWMKITEFAETLSISYGYLRRLISNSSRTKYYINPLDIIREPICRIHYLSKNGELCLPRFLKRRRKVVYAP